MNKKRIKWELAHPKLDYDEYINSLIDEEKEYEI